MTIIGSDSLKGFDYLSVLAVLIFTLSAFTVQDAHAVKFTGSQTGPGEWTYNLTYEPHDNFSICQPSTTITLTNLAGVTSASGPTSSDFSAGYIGLLTWIPAVSNGGTEVVWTHIGGGTGNQFTEKHIFGFKVFSTTIDGTVNVATDGFAYDHNISGPSCPTTDRDIVTTTSGPVVAEKIKLPDCKNIKYKGLTICRDFKYKPAKYVPDYSPVKQLKSGIPINEIQCKVGSQLIFKTTNNNPACVTSEIKRKLIERGWATPNTS